MRDACGVLSVLVQRARYSCSDARHEPERLWFAAAFFLLTTGTETSAQTPARMKEGSRSIEFGAASNLGHSLASVQAQGCG